MKVEMRVSLFSLFTEYLRFSFKHFLHFLHQQVLIYDQCPGGSFDGEFLILSKLTKLLCNKQIV